MKETDKALPLIEAFDPNGETDKETNDTVVVRAMEKNKAGKWDRDCQVAGVGGRWVANLNRHGPTGKASFWKNSRKEGSLYAEGIAGAKVACAWHG